MPLPRNEKGEFDLSNVQAQIDSEGEFTGKFRLLKVDSAQVPDGEWPAHWVDPVHEFDGHGEGETVIDSEPPDPRVDAS